MGEVIIKQLSNPTGYKFNVQTVDGEILYTLSGQAMLAIVERMLGGIVGLPNTIVMTDVRSYKKITLKKIVSFVYEKFRIYDGGNIIAEIQREKKATSKRMFMRVGELNYIATADLTAHHFSVSCDDVEIASIQKMNISLRDSYELTYDNADDALVLILLTICVDSSF